MRRQHRIGYNTCVNNLRFCFRMKTNFSFKSNRVDWLKRRIIVCENWITSQKMMETFIFVRIFWKERKVTLKKSLRILIQWYWKLFMLLNSRREIEIKVLKKWTAHGGRNIVSYKMELKKLKMMKKKGIEYC